MLGLIGTAILWVIIAPILYILGFIISFILQGMARLAGEREVTRLEPGGAGRLFAGTEGGGAGG